ncbi:hypothetical protein Dsin_012349 [Dipteronia sinensis]|uniref:CCHC-type domain-containing protein n=1 Tax=Dipteronia sinensis TaxID=43782 RepID=A0AAE0E838_9ROSI|nr:hypothetical protein Dsin_012349 [Dipteronia sinensis]
MPRVCKLTWLSKWCRIALFSFIFVTGVGNISNLDFKRVKFWIQIPNAPLLCMANEMSKYLGQLIGELVDIDVGVTGECFGKYMWIKVAIDVSKPLKRFLRVELLNKGEESLLLLRYEKLPEYCFHCGIIGHFHQECHNRKEGDMRGFDMDFDYGPWMRALSPPGQNRMATQYRSRGEVYVSRDGGVDSEA